MASWQETFSELKSQYVQRSTDRLAQIIELFTKLMSNPENKDSSAAAPVVTTTGWLVLAVCWFSASLSSWIRGREDMRDYYSAEAVQHLKAI